MNLQELINHPNASIVDVRETWEFAQGHVDGSINIPMNQAISRVDELRQMARPLILICASGNRSGMVQAFLKAKGLTEIYNGGGWHEVKRIRQRRAA